MYISIDIFLAVSKSVVERCEENIADDSEENGDDDEEQMSAVENEEDISTESVVVPRLSVSNQRYFGMHF